MTVALNLSVEGNAIKEHGVYKVLYIDSDIVDQEVKDVVFFVTPSIPLMKRIARMIHKN